MRFNILFMLITAFLLVSVSAFAQDSLQAINLKKYWHYRERLNYFVVPGQGDGMSLVCGIRNKWQCDCLDYGDQTIYMGWYMGMLATEYYLLSREKQDVSRVVREIFYVLEAFKQLDQCETRCYARKDKNKPDGFFVRYHLNPDFARRNSDHLNHRLDTNNTIIWNIKTPGIPGPVKTINEESLGSRDLSQDQAIHILLGLALINKCFPDTILAVKDTSGNIIGNINFKDTVQQISHLLISYLQNKSKTYGRKVWRIYNPDSNYVARGWYVLVYAQGIAAAGKSINGMRYRDRWLRNPLSSAEWQILQFTTAMTASNDHMSLVLASIGNSWKFLGRNTTYRGILRVARKHYQWENFYLMLWQFLNDESKGPDFRIVEKIIDEAPYEGPYYYKGYPPPPNGWASSCKFRMDYDEQVFGQQDFPGNYNGIDYMLFYNLYHILKNPLPYIPVNDQNQEQSFSY